MERVPGRDLPLGRETLLTCLPGTGRGPVLGTGRGSAVSVPARLSRRSHSWHVTEFLSSTPVKYLTGKTSYLRLEVYRNTEEKAKHA